MQNIPRLLNLSLFAVLLAAGACGADSPPEGCQVALLRNGFTIQFARREVAGAAARLWLCADAGSGYMEIPSEQIIAIERRQAAVPLAPAAPVSATETTARDPLKNLIASAASRHQIDPDFVASVVKAESGFVTTAASPKGALGLMQLMPETAARLGVKNVFDPAANLEGGTKYLRQLLDRYDGDTVKALAAYNAGPQRVEQYGGIPPYRETYVYVARIIDDYNRKKLRNSTAAPADK